MSDEGGSSNLNEKVLVILLRASAVLLLTAVIPAVMPFAWMDEIHRHLGMGELPTGPIVSYLTRSRSAIYALHGALVLFVSLDVCRYLPVIRCLAVLAMVFGSGLVVQDIMVWMPSYWVIGECPLAIVLGGVLLWFAGRIDQGSDMEA